MLFIVIHYCLLHFILFVLVPVETGTVFRSNWVLSAYSFVCPSTLLWLHIKIFSAQLSFYSSQELPCFLKPYDPFPINHRWIWWSKRRFIDILIFIITIWLGRFDFCLTLIFFNCQSVFLKISKHFLKLSTIILDFSFSHFFLNKY